MMRVKAVLQLYLKDRPRGHLGVSSETWVFDEKELRIDSFLVGVLRRTAPFFAMCYTAEQLNAQLDAFKEWIAHMRFTDEKLGAV